MSKYVNMLNFIKTNAAEINKYEWEEPVLVKPFEIDGEESFMEPTRRTKGVLRICPGSEEIEVGILHGCNPDVVDLLAFVVADKDVALLIKNYFQKGRKRAYSIRHSFGQSGREDIYINFPDKTGLIVDDKHLLHVSCFGKVSGIKKMYIGDFWEMLMESIENSDSFISQYRNTTAKYVKPYFAENIKTKVSR